MPKGNTKLGAKATGAHRKRNGGKAGKGTSKGNGKKMQRVTEVAGSMRSRPNKAAAKSGGGRRGGGDTSMLRRAYDPTCPIIPPSLYAHHGVFIVNSTARLDLAAVVNKVHMLICTAIPGFGTVGLHMVWNVSPSTALATAAHFTIPQLKDPATSTGPSSSRCTKVGMRIVNAAPRLHQSGKVYVTHLTQRMRLPASPAAMTSDEWNTYVATLRGMPERYTKPYNWADFASSGKMEDKPIYCRVVDVPKYNDFSTHQGTESSITGFLDNCAVWPGSTETPHPMSLAIVTWDAPSVADRLPDLTCSMDAQFMTRWPVDSVPGIAQFDVGASPPEHVKIADESVKR